MNLQQQNNTLTQENALLRTRVQDLQDQLNASQRDQQYLRNKLEEINMTRTYINDQLAQLNQDYEDRIRDLQNKLERMAKVNQKLTAANSNLQEEQLLFEQRFIEKQRLLTMLFSQQQSVGPSIQFIRPINDEVKAIEQKNIGQSYQQVQRQPVRKPQVQIKQSPPRVQQEYTQTIYSQPTIVAIEQPAIIHRDPPSKLEQMPPSTVSPPPKKQIKQDSRQETIQLQPLPVAVPIIQHPEPSPVPPPPPKQQTVPQPPPRSSQPKKQARVIKQIKTFQQQQHKQQASEPWMHSSQQQLHQNKLHQSPRVDPLSQSMEAFAPEVPKIHQQVNKSFQHESQQHSRQIKKGGKPKRKIGNVKVLNFDADEPPKAVAPQPDFLSHFSQQIKPHYQPPPEQEPQHYDDQFSHNFSAHHQQGFNPHGEEHQNAQNFFAGLAPSEISQIPHSEDITSTQFFSTGRQINQTMPKHGFTHDSFAGDNDHHDHSMTESMNFFESLGKAPPAPAPNPPSKTDKPKRGKIKVMDPSKFD